MTDPPSSCHLTLIPFCLSLLEGSHHSFLHPKPRARYWTLWARKRESANFTVSSIFLRPWRDLCAVRSPHWGRECELSWPEVGVQGRGGDLQTLVKKDNKVCWSVKVFLQHPLLLGTATSREGLVPWKQPAQELETKEASHGPELVNRDRTSVTLTDSQGSDGFVGGPCGNIPSLIGQRGGSP